MVLYKCTGCKTETSWRYHKLSAVAAIFYTKFCNAFDVSISSDDHIVLCHSCAGTIKRTEEFVQKLVQNNKSDTTTVPIINTDVPCTRSDVCSTIHSIDINSSDVSRSSSKDTVSGVKRSHDSDHSYLSNATATYTDHGHGDHDYVCNLYGEEEEELEEEEHYEKSSLEEIKSLLPQFQYSSAYNFPSVLKTTSLTAISEGELLKDIIIELIERCPDLLQTFASVCVKDTSSISMRHIASIAVAYSALMFARNNKNSALQRCITMLAVKGNANDEFIRRLNRISLTLSCSGKLNILQKAAETSKEMLIRTITSNPRCNVTGDNLDMYIVTNHQRLDNHNRDIHWFASNLTTARLDYTDLSTDTPNVQLDCIRPESFLLNCMERRKLEDVQKVIIGRIVSECANYEWLTKKLPDHIPHRYSEYMSRKQEVFTLPVFFKNESKNEDCLDILQRYEEELTGIFSNAYGNLDELNKHGVVLGGDQLTRERFQSVKNIRHIAATIEGRFGHLFPIVCEQWHVKQDILAKAYKALFKPESIGDKGTLYHAKVILGRNDVNGNVKSNYKAHEDLFLLMVKALIQVVVANMENIQMERDVVLQTIFDRICGKGYGSDDYILNYYVNLLTWGLQILNLNDTAKEGDIERLVINIKHNVSFFYNHSKDSKYFSECVNMILLVEHILSPAMKLRVLEGAFINTSGKAGKNKEADLVQEHGIRNKKDLIRSLGANKTEKAVLRACSAADTCIRTCKNVDMMLGIPRSSTNHTKKSSQKDLDILIKSLKLVDPFNYSKGRQFDAFPKISKNPCAIVQHQQLLDGIKKKMKRLYLNY